MFMMRYKEKPSILISEIFFFENENTFIHYYSYSINEYENKIEIL